MCSLNNEFNLNSKKECTWITPCYPEVMIAKLELPNFTQGVPSLNLTSQAFWVTAQGIGGWLDPTAGLDAVEKREEVDSRLTKHSTSKAQRRQN